MSARASFHICRRGEPSSAMRLDGAPTPSELEELVKAGFELACVGGRFRRVCACPVNGDGYWYTRRYLLDGAGGIVGSVEDADGPRGEV